MYYKNINIVSKIKRKIKKKIKKKVNLITSSLARVPRQMFSCDFCQEPSNVHYNCHSLQRLGIYSYLLTVDYYYYCFGNDMDVIHCNDFCFGPSLKN